MKAYGKDISDEKVVKKILICVNKKYDAIVTAIEESKDIS